MHSQPHPSSPALGYELVWPDKQAAPAGPEPAPLPLRDAFDGPHGELPALPDFRNRLVQGDNLRAMESLLPEFRGRVDLIYLDPPFNAGQSFRMQVPLEGEAESRASIEAVAYRDCWTGPAEYLRMLHPRLLRARELLSETGSLIVHVNWRVGHLVQALLDELLGPGERRGPGLPGFRNEIIWGYGGGGAARNAYRRKHDNLFWYTRSGRWTFQPQYRPYSEKTRQRGLTAVKGDRYALRREGATLESWWTDPGVQKILSPTAAENLKFPTQKPEALLERILRGHSNPGDLVADFFCGSGTTGAVAERLGRRWLMADESEQAIRLARKRLCLAQERAAAAGRPFRAFDLYRAESEAPAGGSLRVAPVRHPDGAFDIELLDFTPRRPVADGLGAIDYWAIDFEYDASRGPGERPPFRHEWRSYRLGRRGRIALRSNRGYRYPAPGPRMAAVKVIDLFGDETFALVSLDGPPAPDPGGPGERQG